MNQIDSVYQFLNNSSLFHFAIFLVFVVLSILIGQHTANIINLIFFICSRQQRHKIHKNWIEPIKNKINLAGTWILLYSSLHWLKKYEISLVEEFYFVIDITFTIFVIWIFSCFFRHFTKVYGVSFLQNIGVEATEFLLAVETIFNLIFGLTAFTIFAYQHGVPLTGLLAGVSISGLALSFAAQNTLQQLFGTVILLLDKPFIPKEYIRLPDGTFGRVESIGLRSTKIRTVAKNTLLIVPNSKMADWQIENVTRGKKVMILSYFNFDRLLEEYEKSLVRQIITKYIDSSFAIEPETCNVTFLHHPDKEVSRARITFFILGSTESSIELRKQVVHVSATKLSEELRSHGIYYTANEPIISFDSPITL